MEEFIIHRRALTHTIFGKCKSVTSEGLVHICKHNFIRTARRMAEKSGGGLADTDSCRKCDQTVEAGNVCVKCESQQRGECSSTHPTDGASGQGQEEAGQRGNDRVTSGTEGSETLQVAPEGGVNPGQENQARERGEAGALATGSDVQDKRQGSEEDVNWRRMDVQRVETHDKLNQKGIANQEEATKTTATALPVVMSYASGEVVSSTYNPGQEGMKQGSTAMSTDIKSSGENRMSQVSAEKPNSTVSY